MCHSLSTKRNARKGGTYFIARWPWIWHGWLASEQCYRRMVCKGILSQFRWCNKLKINFFFLKCPGIVGLNEYQFTSFWVESKSIFRNYAQSMAITQRIMDTKDIVHHIDCSLCKTDIIGLRFKCTICTDFSLCFQCFCVDTNTEHHTLSHRLGDVYVLRKCRLLLKKCWRVLGCRDGTSGQSLEMTTIKTNFDEFRHEFATITNQSVSSLRPTLSRRNSHQIECKCRLQN